MSPQVPPQGSSYFAKRFRETVSPEPCARPAKKTNTGQHQSAPSSAAKSTPTPTQSPSHSPAPTAHTSSDDPSPLTIITLHKVTIERWEFLSHVHDFYSSNTTGSDSELSNSTVFKKLISKEKYLFQELDKANYHVVSEASLICDLDEVEDEPFTKSEEGGLSFSWKSLHPNSHGFGDFGGELIIKNEFVRKKVVPHPVKEGAFVELKEISTADHLIDEDGYDDKPSVHESDDEDCSPLKGGSEDGVCGNEKEMVEKIGREDETASSENEGEDTQIDYDRDRTIRAKSGRKNRSIRGFKNYRDKASTQSIISSSATPSNASNASNINYEKSASTAPVLKERKQNMLSMAPERGDLKRAQHCSDSEVIIID